jgi:hypothetical protein
MDADLARLVRAGTISRQLAEQRASVPEELKRLLAGTGAVMPGNGLAGADATPQAPVYTTGG